MRLLVAHARRRDGRLGAFVIAAETGTPLMPVTLNGTRSLLRDKAWLPNRSQVRVMIGVAIAAAGPGWDHALELRDAARKLMAAMLAEPTLTTELLPGQQ